MGLISGILSIIGLAVVIIIVWGIVAHVGKTNAAKLGLGDAVTSVASFSAYNYPIVTPPLCSQYNVLQAYADNTAATGSGVTVNGPLVFQGIAGYEGKLGATSLVGEYPSLSLCSTSDSTSGRVIPIYVSLVFSLSKVSSTFVNATRLDFFSQGSQNNSQLVGYLNATSSPNNYQTPSTITPGLVLQPVSIYRWTATLSGTQLYYEILYPGVALTVTLFGNTYNLRTVAGYM